MSARTFRIAHDIPPGHHRLTYLAAHAQALQDAGGATLDVRFECADLSSSGARMLDDVRRGTLDLAWLNACHLEHPVPELVALLRPYALDDVTMCAPSNAAEVVAAADHVACARGLRVLGIMRAADQVMWLRDAKVRALADLEGLRIRIPGGALYARTFDALGIVSVELPIGRVEAALASGELDGFSASVGGWASTLGMRAPHGVSLPSLLVLVYLLVAQRRDDADADTHVDLLALAALEAERKVTGRWRAMKDDDDRLIAEHRARGLDFWVADAATQRECRARLARLSGAPSLCVASVPLTRSEPSKATPRSATTATPTCGLPENRLEQVLERLRR
ncbi:MAG: TRAP transporter substrate-binding protein DctP [Proteobacteria bacterium]|nr:TRAP transporter substrate-binding protein DctP [Burkholderiales bacterium]